MGEKIAFIATILNEEESIEEFVESVLAQSKMPNEIILVDGGSVDRTLRILEKYTKKNIITVLSKAGNRSVGRNEAIRYSKSDILVVSDAGCILDKNWIQEITRPFANKSVDVVSGFYHPVTDTIFQKALATYTCVMPDRVDGDNFLPSSRSVAFRKSAWKKVGGYPEHLSTCEDLVFATRLKKAGLKFVFTAKAVVRWPQRRNLIQAFKQFYSYAVGDGKAQFIRPQTPFLYARYGIGALVLYYAMENKLLWILLLTGFILYLLWAVWKNYRYVEDARAIVLLPLLQLTADFAVLTGTSVGLIMGLWGILKAR